MPHAPSTSACCSTVLKPLACLASALAFSLLLGSCQQQPIVIAPGIEPTPREGFFGRRTQEPLRAEQADVAVVFIGGFAEKVAARFRMLYESTPLLPVEGRQLRAHYAWDGGRGNVLFHSTTRIRRDLETFFALNPQADLILVGHSYGGSAAMDVVRHLQGPHGRIIVATVDPVSRRERSHPGERPEGVEYWVNSYCSDYEDYKDSIAWVGGAWRDCPQADKNLPFSGEMRDQRGKRYQHAYPLPLFRERCPATQTSAYEELVAAAKRLQLGAPSVKARAAAEAAAKQS